MTIRITFGGEGTPDPLPSWIKHTRPAPLLERAHPPGEAHQTLPWGRHTRPSWGGHTRPIPSRGGTPDPPLLERAHQTLPSWRGHTRPSPPGEGTPDPPLLEGASQTLPIPGKQCIAGAGARLLLTPIRGRVLVSARHPQHTQGSVC